MKSRMVPRHYLSQEVFDHERSKLFRKLWVFAGLRTLVRRPNDFITRVVAGIPVVIQNMDGELKAFENVCLHRGARLQAEPVGCRPLVCPYHCWRYDASGAPAKIPLQQEIYRYSDEELHDMRLRQFALRAIGNVLFINLDPEPLPIEAQFAPAFLETLESSSSSYDTEVMTTTFRTNFNWKLGYENLRDGNHVGFVHSKSIARHVSFDVVVDDALAAETGTDLPPELPREARRAMLRRFSHGGPEGSFREVRRFDWQANVERWGTQDAYFNWLAYPNLHISSSDGGHSFSIEHHVPVSPGRTDMEIYWMTAKKRVPFAYSGTVLASLMHGTKLVVGEDIQIIEEVQAAMHDGAPVARQGHYEAFNRLVERWYVDIIDGDHEV
jgi:phenylpropionate dioxygenase-like ring-hydroxylating dioxygenase large terminal subunit